MRKTLLLCFVVAACASSTKTTGDSRGANFALTEEFVPRIRAIAAEYGDWTRLGDVTAWAPTSCVGPSLPAPFLSESTDDASHGRKLYFLFARNVAAYRTAREGDQPVGQAFVKQSFEAVRTARRSRDFHRLYQEGRATVRRGEGWQLGEQRDLFVMYKLAPDTPNTDVGWVYGTVTVEGEVTSAGRVLNCVECHAGSSRDRMFGAAANNLVAESGQDAYEQLIREPAEVDELGKRK